MNRRSGQKKITDLARGKPCQIRLAGICNGDPATVVACHFRLAGLSGMGYIAEPIFAAWGCNQCHAYCDSHKDAQTQLAFAHGVFWTLHQLLKEGVIHVD